MISVDTRHQTHGQSVLQPRLLVFSSLFPNSGTPNAGIFIRERMFRVAGHLPLCAIVSPRPWFPGQGLIRRFRPYYRQGTHGQEVQNGIRVLLPRFIAAPSVLRRLDGLSMALCCYPLLRRLRNATGFNLLDAHFAYPDGYAATLLGKWLGVPVTITLRGTEVPHSRNPALRPLLLQALRGATRLFAVSDSLRQEAISLGIEPDKIRVVGNGVDTARFYPVDCGEARARLGIPEAAKVLVSVGALVERKGFHRVIECLPELGRGEHQLHYLIVGGGTAEGDRRRELEQQVRELRLENRVHFLGAMPPDELKWPLSAADVFVLATANEGWANVFLEAMACGLPVITTDVGGNAEVVSRPELGSIVPFGDRHALLDALRNALVRQWDTELIREYARENDWDTRVACLTGEFRQIVGMPGTGGCVSQPGVEVNQK
jgi:glycosyltransferase involved in cell wall biosynthesis